MKLNQTSRAKADNMGTTIKARFSGGFLKPLELLELKEGEEVTVTIVALPSESRKGWLERTAGGWVGLVDAEELKRAVYESRFGATRPEPRL